MNTRMLNRRRNSLALVPDAVTAVLESDISSWCLDHNMTCQTRGETVGFIGSVKVHLYHIAIDQFDAQRQKRIPENPLSDADGFRWSNRLTMEGTNLKR